VRRCDGGAAKEADYARARIAWKEGMFTASQFKQIGLCWSSSTFCSSFAYA
jgi:hypothetical protein